MADMESADPTLDERPPQITVDPEILLPFSSREVFSERVCGLPSCNSDCQRAIRIKATRDTGDRHRGDQLNWPGVLASPLPPGPLEWIVFRKSPEPRPPSEHAAGQWGFRAIWYPSADAKAANTDAPEDYPVARFAFRPGIEGTLRAEHRLDPVFAEYKRDKDNWITSWLPENADEDRSSLQCFGPAIFDEQEIWFHNTRSEFVVRIADLITSYIDNKCRPYRQNKYGSEFGTFLCQAELDLENKNRKTLPFFDIWFSYLDLPTRELRRFDGLQFLNNNKTLDSFIEVPPKMLGGNLRGFDSVSQLTEVAPSYADFFTDGFRGWLFPDEVADGQLLFSLGEVSAYLLYWITSRLLAESREFREAFHGWLSSDAWPSADDTEFERLLNTPVCVAALPHLVTLRDEVTPDPTARARAFITPEGGSSFRELLEGFWLKKEGGFGQRVASAMAEFLQSEFGGFAASTTRRADQLPMYQRLGWKWNASHRGASSQIEADDTRWKLVRDVLRAQFSELSVRNVEDYPTVSKLIQHCAFPLGTVLTSWPEECRFYVIVPIWISSIEGRSIPVIYGHVFCRHPNWPDGANPKDELSAATPVFPVLRMFGRTIADAYYREQIRIADAWKAAAGWAHEVTNYMRVTIGYADEILAAKNATFEEIQPRLQKSHALMTALSNVARAVQQTLAKKLDFMKLNIEPPEPLPPAIAARVVELALQEALDLHAGSSSSFELSWEPCWSQEQRLAAREEVDTYYWMHKARPAGTRPLSKYQREDALGEARKKRWGEALERNWVIWASALLREAVWNIRPFGERGDRVVRVAYDLIAVNQRVTLTIRQSQMTMQPAASLAAVGGVDFANLVFGRAGTGFGEIRVGQVRSTEVPGAGFRSDLETQITFIMGRALNVSSA